MGYIRNKGCIEGEFTVQIVCVFGAYGVRLGCTVIWQGAYMVLLGGAFRVHIGFVLGAFRVRRAISH